MAPTEFDRPVNPIPTHFFYPVTPSRFADIPTVLKRKMKVAIEGKTFYNVSLLGSEPFIVVSLL